MGIVRILSFTIIRISGREVRKMRIKLEYVIEFVTYYLFI